MADIQEQINKILSNPEALRQVQSLGEQLGLTNNAQHAQKPIQPPASLPSKQSMPMNNIPNDDMLKTMTRLAPLMQSVRGEDDTTRLLNALRPFLCDEKRQKLDKAEKMIKMIKILPLLRENGLF